MANAQEQPGPIFHSAAHRQTLVGGNGGLSTSAWPCHHLLLIGCTVKFNSHRTLGSGRMYLCPGSASSFGDNARFLISLKVQFSHLTTKREKIQHYCFLYAGDEHLVKADHADVFTSS